MLINQFARAVALCALSLSCITTALLNPPCPLLNAYYSAPRNLSSSSHIRSAIEASRSQLQKALDENSPSGLLDANTTSFSVEIYSIHSEAVFTYHFTPELLRNQTTVGVLTVDSNTVYRIGSVSKLWTVFIYLIAAGDATWNEPITKFIPELAARAKENTKSPNSVDTVSWSQVTIGALCSQLAGIGRDAAYSAQLAAGLEQLGFQDHGDSSHSTCGDATRSMLPCNRTAFFDDFTTQHPVTSPFQTPIYSNAAYQILSYALENITGSSMEYLFQKALVEPLNLNATYYKTPQSTNSSIIPGNATVSWWDGNTRDETPAGGYYSSLNDMRAVGRAMLNATLLRPALTRSWMKPRSFTSNPDMLVGAPWEIIRAPGDPPSWMYTKSGNLGSYAALVGLMPDLELGFSVLAAGENPSMQVSSVASIVTSNFVPAFWEQAKRETAQVYGGVYTDESTNSSLAIDIASDGPGLIAKQFTVGGLDIVSVFGEMLGSPLTLRLYPMGLSAKGENGTDGVSWRAIIETESQRSAPSRFATCTSWGVVNEYIYGGVGLDEFIFTIDAAGTHATRVEYRIAGVSEPRVSPLQQTQGTLRRM